MRMGPAVCKLLYYAVLNFTYVCCVIAGRGVKLLTDVIIWLKAINGFKLNTFL